MFVFVCFIQGINITCKGNHKHDTKSLATSHNINIGKGKEISTELTLKDNSKKLKKLSGTYKLTYPGKKVYLSTDLTQPSSRQYKHTITGKYGKKKGSITTIYTKGRGGLHTVTSDIILPNVDHTRITGNTNLNLHDFKASGNVLYGKKEYGVETVYKYIEKTRGKLALNVKYPSREIELELVGERNDSEFSGSFDAKWDKQRRIQATGSLNIPSINDVDSTFVLKYPSQVIKFNLRHHKPDDYISHADLSWSQEKKIVLDMTFTGQDWRGSNTKRAVMSLKTPFKPLDDVAVKITAGNDNREYAITTKVQWNGKLKEVTSSVKVQKPASVRNLNIFVTVSSPFERIRQLTFDMKHRLTNKLDTEVKASLNRKNVELFLSGDNRSVRGKRDVTGLISFKSNIRKMRSLELQVKHFDDWVTYKTDVVVDINGKKYVYDLDMNHQNRGYHVVNSGKLYITAGSYYQLTNSWQHSNTDKSIKTVITSEWGNGNRIHFDMSGNYDLSQRIKYAGSLELETPWSPLRSVSINLSNEFGNGYFSQQTHFIHDGVPKVSTNVNFVKKPDAIDADFIITTPWIEDISGKLNTRSDRNPKTVHGELQWSRNEKVTVDGSLTAVSLNSFNGNLQIKTPYDKFKNIFVRASQQKKGLEHITTAAVEYSARKTIEFENRIQLEKGIKIFSKIETPFSEFEKIQAGFQFHGDLYDFNTKAEFTASPILGTFKGNLKWNYVSDLDGKLRIDMPFKKFQYVQLSLKNDNSNHHFMAEAEYYPRQIITLDAKYKYNGPIDVETTLKTPFKHAKNINAAFKHAMTNHGMQTSARAKYETYDPMEVKLKLKWNEGIDGTVSLKTPIKEIKNSKIVIHHRGSINDFTNTFDFRLNKEKLLFVNIEVQDDDETKGTMTITSNRFDDIKLTVTKNGNLEDFQGSATLTYGDSQEVKAAIQNEMSQKLLKSSVSIETPFTEDIVMMVEYKGNWEKFTAKVSGSFGQMYTINNDFSFSTVSQLIEGSNILSYKLYDETNRVGFSFHKDGIQSNWSANVEGYMNDKRIKVAAHFTHDENVGGSVNVETPFDSFQDVGLSFKHSGTRNNFMSEGTVTYMDGKTLQGKAKIQSSSLRDVRGKLSATTPFDGFRNASVEHRHHVTNNDFKINFKIELPNSPDITADIHLSTTGPNAEFEVIANTNMDGFRKVVFEVKKSGSANHFTGEVSFIAGDKVIKGDVSHRVKNGNIDTKINLSNPFTKAIVVSLQHSRRSKGFSTSFVASAGTDTKVDVHASFQHQTRDSFQLTSNAEFKMDGSGSKAKFNIKKKETHSNMEVTVVGEFNDETVNVHLSVYQGDRVFGELTITTPFEYYRNIGFTLEYSGSVNDFSSKATFQHKENKYEAAITHSNNRWHKIDSKVEIKTPFGGYENLQAGYSHRSDSNSKQFTCDVSVRYGQGNEISAKVRISLTPRQEFEITIATPYKGFKRWTVNGQFEKSMKRYEASGQITGGADKTVSFHSSVDFSGSPYTVSINIQTPFKGFEINDLSVTHKGTPTNFEVTFEMSSPVINTVKGSAHLNLKTPNTLDAKVSVSSRIQGMENLNFAVRTSNESDQKKLHTEVAWASGKEIIMDISSRSHNDWNDRVLSFIAVISTPFNTARRESLKIEQSIGSDSYSNKIEVEHNAETILDMDIDYSKYPRYEASVTVRNPRPMRYAVSGRLDGNAFDGDMMLNWDKNEPNSNVRFETSYGDKEGLLDKDIKFKLIHPVRTMGITGSLKSTQRHTSSQAEVSWDEAAGHKISYDFSLKDRSRRHGKMYDSSIKVGIPGRSLQLTGSYGGNRKVKTVDGSFLWDADEDQNKAIGMKATFQPSDSRADITFSLPSIGKVGIFVLIKVQYKV